MSDVWQHTGDMVGVAKYGLTRMTVTHVIAGSNPVVYPSGNWYSGSTCVLGTHGVGSIPAFPIMIRHEGDCSFYASIANRWLTDGICTCGYGRYIERTTGLYDQLISKDRMDEYRKTNPPVSDEEMDIIMSQVFGRIETAPPAFFVAKTG